MSAGKGRRNPSRPPASAKRWRPDPRTKPCPEFCRVDHGQKAEIEQETAIRLHEVRLPEIFHGSDYIASVAVATCDDLETGERTAVTVSVGTGDGELSPDHAARLAGQLTIASAVARTGAGPTDSETETVAGVHSWCVGEMNRTCDGMDCMSEPVDTLATAGEQIHQDAGGVTVGVASVYAETRDDGRPGVHLVVAGPTGLGEPREAWVSFTPSEARQFAARVLAEAERVEST
ncbi:DUF6907 domain-containing protein [Plantactinospora solaniradicis]|uniref:DUF6907 domain-containing protein n=1 Tax=Plantactinospora solaniradicis TaxID=1723736 RepID=A0ABW1K8H6_9ACTN